MKRPDLIKRNIERKRSDKDFHNLYIPEPNSGCWLWIGAYTSHNYGSWGHGDKAHRKSWELHNGSIPKGLCVLHKCDVKICVNPQHLFLGTRTDNIIDMDKKHRRFRKCFHTERKIYRNSKGDYSGRYCSVCYKAAYKAAK